MLKRQKKFNCSRINHANRSYEKASDNNVVSLKVKETTFQEFKQLRDKYSLSTTELLDYLISLEKAEHPSRYITAIKTKINTDADSVFYSELHVLYEWLKVLMYDLGYS